MRVCVFKPWARALIVPVNCVNLSLALRLTSTATTSKSCTVRYIPLWYAGSVFGSVHRMVCSGGFRPGPRGAQPFPSLFPGLPQFRGHLCFLGQKITQISGFFAFPNCRKVGKFVTSIKRPKTKCASASGGGAMPPWPGALPLDPAGGSAPRPSL